MYALIPLPIYDRPSSFQSWPPPPIADTVIRKNITLDVFFFLPAYSLTFLGLCSNRSQWMIDEACAFPRGGPGTSLRIPSRRAVRGICMLIRPLELEIFRL